MKKIYLSENYIIIDNDGDINPYAKIHSEYNESVDAFQLRKFPDKRMYEIPFIESVEWFDETGLIAFTEATLRTFLRQNSGFVSGGTTGTGKLYKYTVDVYNDLLTVVDPQEGDIARVYNAQGTWPFTNKNEGAYTYLSGVWEYGSRSLQTEILNNDADILALQNEQITQDAAIAENASRIGLQSGIISGGITTINSGDDTKIDISAGTGIICNYVIPTAPVFTPISWSDQIAVTIPDIATKLFSTFYFDSSGTLQNIQDAQASPQLRRQNILLDTAVHNGITISNISANAILAYESSASIMDYIAKLGPINEGNTFTSTGSALALQKIVGATTLPWLNRVTDAQNPATIANASQDPVPQWTDTYRDGSGGHTFSAPTITAIDPDVFDDGSGVLATLGNNKYSVRKFIFFGQNNQMVAVIGQDEYSSLAAAESSLFTDTTDISPFLASGAFVTALILKKGTTDIGAAVTGGTAKFLNITSQVSTAAAGAGSQDLQSTYNLSEPSAEILTNSTQGALSLMQGSGADTDDVLEVKNGAGTQKFSVKGNGDTIANTVLLSADPTLALQAATKQYVDAAAGGMLTETLTQSDGASSGATETSTISIDGMKLRIERSTNSLFKAQLLNETGGDIDVTFTRETFGQSNTVGFGSNVTVADDAIIQFEASAFWNVNSPDTVNVRFIVDGTGHYEASFLGTEIDPTKFVHLTFKKIN